MARKKKEEIKKNIGLDEIPQAEKEFRNALANDTTYSLQVDPNNLYNFSEEDIEFIDLYLSLRNVYAVAKQMKITIIDAQNKLNSFGINSEIKRLTNAMLYNQFNTKMMTLDELGGYITSLLIDQCFAGDLLKASDKLKAARLIMDINKMKYDLYNNPSEAKKIDAIDIENEVQELSIETIKNLLNSSNSEEKLKEKDDLINQIDSNNELAADEIEYLKSLSTKELLKFLDEINKNKEN